MSLDRRGSVIGDILPSAAKGLLRHPDGIWHHYSSQRSTVKLRTLGSAEFTSEKRFDVSDPERERNLLDEIGGSRFYSGWPKENVHEGLERLLGRPSPIPQPRIRRLYENLRDFSDGAVSEALLDNACRNKGRNLIKIFKKSYWHFDQYRNVGEDFGDRTEKRKRGPSSEFAVGLARELEEGRAAPAGAARGWQGDPKLGFDFIGREVSFRRTSGGAFFDDGSSGIDSGKGGLDLWLRAHDGGLPIVGEVKAETDTNAFLALIQALAYTCELVTPAQLERVEEHYGDYFPKGHLTNGAGPYADIYLICEGEPKLLGKTKTLAEYLLADRSTCLGGHVRKIVCLLAPVGGGVDDLYAHFVVE